MSTYTPIATQTLGSAAASVTFSSIPQGYTDLVLIINSYEPSSGASIGIQLNNDTGSNYSYTFMYGDGSSAGSGRASNATNAYVGQINGGTISIVNINNYSNTTTYKTLINRGNASTQNAFASVSLWRNTNAITSIYITRGGTFTAGSTFSLYGIAGGQVTAKAAGGIVSTSGAYTYHTFTTSGSFIPSTNLTVDYLVVAGGGGGGAGGGGAGGLRSTVTATGGGGTLETPLSLTAGISYPVVVGAGGIGGIAYGAGASNGSIGSLSAFSGIVSIGGGGGGSAGGGTGTPSQGGSGGGASYSSGQAYPGLGTAGQGYNGGPDVVDGPPYAGPGGGGAGAAGNPAINDSTAGAGGVGVAVAITGSSVYYAGGGGGYGYGGGTGGAGGNGGGGAGPAGAGTINTGGGGGGAASGVQGGSGGSGIVIVRYLT